MVVVGTWTSSHEEVLEYIEDDKDVEENLVYVFTWFTVESWTKENYKYHDDSGYDSHHKSDLKSVFF